MPFDSGASPPVRPTAETLWEPKKDFDCALDQALAPLDSVMGPRRRAEALCRARQQIHAAVAAMVAAERRRVVQAMTPAQLRVEVLQLIASHEALVDYIEDLERWSVIAAELRRLRCRGEIRWVL
jgi:hypothetical protein